MGLGGEGGGEEGLWDGDEGEGEGVEGVGLVLLELTTYARKKEMYGIFNSLNISQIHHLRYRLLTAPHSLFFSLLASA